MFYFFVHWIIMLEYMPLMKCLRCGKEVMKQNAKGKWSGNKHESLGCQRKRNVPVKFRV